MDLPYEHPNADVDALGDACDNCENHNNTLDYCRANPMVCPAPCRMWPAQ